MSVLDGYVHDALNDALAAADLPQDAVVTRSEMSGPEWEPVVTDVNYDCQGWIDDWDAASRAGSLVEQNDRRIYVVASSLAIEPAPSDRVTINSATFSIISVQRDPAGVCFVCQCRT